MSQSSHRKRQNKKKTTTTTKKNTPKNTQASKLTKRTKTLLLDFSSRTSESSKCKQKRKEKIAA